MKKLTKYTFGILISLIFAGNSYAWTISDFHSDIQLNSDGSANITETIQANFSWNSQKHGIFRFIPFQSKTDTGMINLTPISQISVFNERQIPRNFRQETKNDNILLVIGNPNNLVNSLETYVIKYKIDRVPKEFSENNFAEFYWNVTGSEWEVEIKKASATISLPTISKINKTICFTGKHGSKEKNCSAKMENNKAIFVTNSSLFPGQGLTVDYGFDKSIVKTFQFKEISETETYKVEDPEETWLENFFNRIGGWAWSILALIYPIFYAWQEKKKVAIDKPIIPKYEPPKGIHPSLLGTVIDNSFDKRDFTAGIIDLAVNGYLTIEKKKVKGLIWDSEEYFLRQNPVKKNPTTTLRNNIYSNLFGEIARELTTSTELFTYYDSVADRKTGPDKKNDDEIGGIFPYRHKDHMFKVFNNLKVNTQLLGKQYFRGISGQGTGILMTLFIVAGIVGFWGGTSLYISEKVIMAVFISSFIGFGGLTILYPKRTKEGLELAHEAKCYKEFLETADIDKLNWAEKQEIFEKNLPYAVAFGLTEKWAKIFGDTIVEPRWMHGAGGVGNLAKNLDSITENIAKNIQAPKSSSGSSGFGGGGFSGGGSGGGGGGSW